MVVIPTKPHSAIVSLTLLLSLLKYVETDCNILFGKNEQVEQYTFLVYQTAQKIHLRSVTSLPILQKTVLVMFFSGYIQSCTAAVYRVWLVDVFHSSRHDRITNRYYR